MTTDSMNPLNASEPSALSTPPGTERRLELRALVVSPDASYRGWATDALGAAALPCDCKLQVRVEASLREPTNVLSASSTGRIDIVLLEDAALADGQRTLPEEFLAAHPGAIVMQRCTAIDVDSHEPGIGRDHRVLHGGLLQDLEGEGLNLSALPTILCFAIERNQANAVARDCNEQLQLLGDLSPGAILIVDDEGIPCYANGRYRSLSGQASRRREELLSWCAAIHPDDRDRVETAWRRAACERAPLSITFRYVQPDGKALRVRARGRVLPAQPGTRDRALMAFSMEPHAAVASITTLRAAERALHDEKEHSRLLLEAIDEAVILTDQGGRVRVFNPVAEAMTGWPRENALGQDVDTILRLVDASTREPLSSPVKAVLVSGEDSDRAFDCMLLGRAGSEHLIECLTVPVRDQAGAVDGALVVFHDQLQSRVVAEHMAFLAYHDVLTGLPNRALLLERMTQAIRVAQRNGTMLALVFTDIDDFKVINDSLGHDAGDELLIMAAHRLRRCVRATDTICRYGGDEYVALLTEVDRPEDALHVAEKMTAAMHRSFTIDGHTVRVSMSTGTSVYPYDGHNAKALLEIADRAMYEHKRRNKTAGAAQPG